MFLLSAKAQVDDEWFALYAAGQNNVEERTLNAESRVYCEILARYAQDIDWFEEETTKHVELVFKERPGKEP